MIGCDNDEFMDAEVAIGDDWSATAVRRGYGVCPVGYGLAVVYGHPRPEDAVGPPSWCFVPRTQDAVADLRLLREAVKGEWFDHAAASRAEARRKSKKNDGYCA